MSISPPNLVHHLRVNSWFAISLHASYCCCFWQAAEHTARNLAARSMSRTVEVDLRIAAQHYPSAHHTLQRFRAMEPPMGKAEADSHSPPVSSQVLGTIIVIPSQHCWAICLFVILEIGFRQDEWPCSKLLCQLSVDLLRSLIRWWARFPIHSVTLILFCFGWLGERSFFEEFWSSWIIPLFSFFNCRSKQLVQRWSW